MPGNDCSCCPPYCYPPFPPQNLQPPNFPKFLPGTSAAGGGAGVGGSSDGNCGSTGNQCTGSQAGWLTLPPTNNDCLCLTSDTAIPLAEGGCKLASEIRVGDLLAGRGEVPQRVATVVSSVQRTVQIATTVGTVECSVSHQFLSADSEPIRA